MGLLSVALLPARAVVGGAELLVATGRMVAPGGPVRRPGGYADRLTALLAEAGALEQLGRLGDPDGPLAHVDQLAGLTADDRPLGRALAAGGPLDRLLADDGVLERVLAEGGPLDRLMSDDGVVDRLLRPDGPLDRLLAPDGALERLTAPGASLDRLLEPGGALERVTTPDGLLDQALSEDRVLQLMDTFARLAELQESLRAVGALAGALEALAISTQRLPDLAGHVRAVDARVDSIGERLDRFEPSLALLSGSVETLGRAAETMNELVEPLTRLAERIPGGRGRGNRD